MLTCGARELKSHDSASDVSVRRLDDHVQDVVRGAHARGRRGGKVAIEHALECKTHVSCSYRVETGCLVSYI